MAKKQTPKANKTKAKPAPKQSPAKGELSEDALDRVTGGASDYLLKIDGIEGESQTDKYPGVTAVAKFFRMD